MKLIYFAIFFLVALQHPLAQQRTPVMVNSGAGTLEMVISGSGSPAVVFESGFSDTYEYWDAVVATVSTKTKTVQYNRAGFGHSALNGRPRTADEIATELHTALSNAKIPPPYILVGHSAGGMYIRVFAHLFPSDVVGVVLVDPAPEAFYAMLAQEDPALWKALTDDLKNAPPGAQAQMDVNATTVDEVKAAWPLPPVPVVLISATKLFTPEWRKKVTSLQTAFIQRIPGVQQIEATGCGHNIPGECPAVISNTVLTMLTNLSKK
jgi:pimeloyl-ACP methyl ester carboxylesterase